MIYHLHGLLSAIKTNNDKEIDYHKTGYDAAKQIKADPQAANIAEMKNNSKYQEFSKKKFLTFLNDKTADVRQRTHYEKQFLQNPAKKYDMPRVSDLQNIENPNEDLIKKLERQKESQATPQQKPETVPKTINGNSSQQKPETAYQEELPPIRHEYQSSDLQQKRSDTSSQLYEQQSTDLQQKRSDTSSELYERRYHPNLDRKTSDPQEDQIPQTIIGNRQAREFQQRRSDANNVARYKNEQALARDTSSQMLENRTTPKVLNTKPVDQQRSTQFQNQQRLLSNTKKFKNTNNKESYKGNIKYNQTSKGHYEVGGKIKRR